LILAAGSLSTLISGAPVPSFPSDVTQVTSTHLSQEQRRSVATYLTTFGGTGDVADGWPTVTQWVKSFDTMFSDNNDILKSGCAQFGVAENSDDEISDLSSSIKSVASSTGVDPRFILAIVMQESNGCVRAPTTNYGVRNPGLMQSHDGSGTCNDATVSNPCPASSITQMIQDGVGGTAAGDGLKTLLAKAGTSDASQYYKAARMYNSGSIDASGNLGSGIATHCYASDIANRLMGWSSGPSSCSPGSVGSLSKTIGSIAGASSSDSTDADTESSQAEPAASTTSAPEPVASSTQASQSTPTSVAGGAFAEEPANRGNAHPSATATPTPTPSPSPTTAPSTPETAAASPVAESTATVVPVQSPAPSATSTSAVETPVATAGAMAAGSACTSEGLWNCISSKSFQQCASGQWSVVQDLADGMQCIEGQSKVFGTSAINKRSRLTRIGS